MQDILAEYDQIIKTRNLDGLLSFLKAKSPGHLDALRKHINKAKRYWMSHVNLENEPEFNTKGHGYWGTRGDIEQCSIITFSAIALFDKGSITSWDEPLWFFNDATKHAYLLEILKWSKPNWLDAYILDKLKRNDWSTVHYSALRLFEKNNLIAYNSELFARSLSRFEHQVGQTAIKGEIQAKLDAFLADELTCQRDIPELFNYETILHNQWVHYRVNGLGPYVKFSIWEYLYTELLAYKKMDRQFFIENALQIQTKDWNNHLKSFFRKRLEEMDISTEELMAFQETIFAYFHALFPPVVNYGVELSKQMYEHPDFDIHSFLEWSSAVMMRVDCKSAIKNLLSVYEKIAKSNPKLQGTIAATIADVFLIPDMGLQERAAKTLQKLGKFESELFSSKLLDYLPQIQGNVKVLLSRWLDDLPANLPETTVSYQYQPAKTKLLTQALNLPDTWNDVLFQCGKFISSDHSHEAEILLNTFICKQELFPDDYTAQLSPYFKQLGKVYFEVVFKNELKVFLMHKMVGLKTPYVNLPKHDTELDSLLLIQELTKVAERKIQQNSSLPLLSLPSHMPYWIAPKVLLERIIAHQEQGEEIDMVDLSIAIARMCREEVDAALPLLAQVDEKLRPLLSFCLGVDKKMDLGDKTVRSKLIAWISGDNQSTEHLALWAVAARTFYPHETFVEFEKTYLREVAFVVRAFQPEFYFKEVRSEWKNYQTQQMERGPTWYELLFDKPEYKKTPKHLLYSLNVYRGSSGWFIGLRNQPNVFYWHSIMPQNPEPLAIRLLSSIGMNSYDSNELKGFLDIVTRPEFWFSELTNLVFACCFFQEKKDTRFMATEVLINSIEQRRLDATVFGEKIAFLISGKYGALLRCIDALAAIKDVSNTHNTALFMILDSVFKNLNIQEKLPANFKKLLEHFLDLGTKTGQKPSAASLSFLGLWRDNASIKNLVKQLEKS